MDMIAPSPPPSLPASGRRAAEPAAAALDIVVFTSGDRARYEQWDDIRRRVFADELGWRLPPRPPVPASLGDPFDAPATLLTAEVDREAIGIVRALRAADGFPHRDLLERHVTEAGVGDALASLGTINALAVVAGRRHQRFEHPSTGAPGTAAAQLLSAALASMSGQGVRAVLATVISAISARVFLRVGFRLLDRPFLRHEGDRFALANVGIVLPPRPADVDRGSATWGRAAAYFDDCHRAAHGTERLDDLFARRG
jgi:hypothetical protein